MKLNKDMLPLYIAVTSGVFSILSTIADNLTKNVKIEVHQELGIQAVKSAPKPSFNLVTFIMSNHKPFKFGSISVVAIIIFFSNCS